MRSFAWPSFRRTSRQLAARVPERAHSRAETPPLARVSTMRTIAARPGVMRAGATINPSR